MELSKSAAAKMIDHTLLKPSAGMKDIEKLCAEAEEYGFASVCVNPVWTRTVSDILAADTDVMTCTVIGFPLGANSEAVKVFEAEQAVRDGADEVDMVIDIGAACMRRYDKIEAEIASVVRAVRETAESCGKTASVKVILEVCFLDDDAVRECCLCAVRAGAAFVKTSTGFGPGGATAERVALMRQAVGDAAGVKASGGIRTADDFLAMVNAGANRIGTSAGIAIINGLDCSA